MNGHAYPRYERYKDSGVEWLGNVPGPWGVRPTKYEFDIVLGKMLQPDARSVNDREVSYLKSLHVQWEKVRGDGPETMWASPNEIARFSVEVGDLLVCEGGEGGRGGLVTALELKPTIIQNALHRVRPRKNNDLRYLLRVLETVSARDWFSVLCNKATIQHFTGDKFGALRIPVPLPAEQTAIADFLDRETTRIDSLIEKQEQLIEKLEEKRKALIWRAVTRGVYPNVRLKASGAEWLGKIPEHWTVNRNKWLFRERDDRSSDGREELLTVSHITGITPRSEKPDVNMFMAESHEGYKRCLPGDLVINTMWAWMGALGISCHAGIVSPGYNVYQPVCECIPRYFDYFFRTPAFVREMTRWSKGVWSSRLRLYPAEFLNILVGLPPVDEQRAIVAHLDYETQRMDEIIQKVGQLIEKLRERRTALISAAVTGRIKVNGSRQ